MTWLKVDDGFWAHPKVMGASADALALWIRAASWSAAQLTEGRVPARFLPTFGGNPTIAAELVDLGLWEVDDEEYLFHDWLDYQPSKDQVEREREAARLRQQKLRNARNGATNATTTAVTTAVTPDAPPVPPVPPASTPSSNEEGVEPSLFCRKHPNGTDQPCGPCRDAREVHDMWIRAQRSRPTLTPIGPPDPITCNHKFIGRDGDCTLCGLMPSEIGEVA